VNRRGQIKLLEAVFCVILIVVVFTVASYIVTPSNPFLGRSSKSLEIFGYYLLDRITSTDLLDKVIFKHDYRTYLWEEELKVIISAYVPVNVYFNLTIYVSNMTDSIDGMPTLHVLNKIPISNVAEKDFFNKVYEVASATVVYTSRKGYILVLNLVLARV